MRNMRRGGECCKQCSRCTSSLCPIQSNDACCLSSCFENCLLREEPYAVGTSLRSESAGKVGGRFSAIYSREQAVAVVVREGRELLQNCVARRTPTSSINSSISTWPCPCIQYQQQLFGHCISMDLLLGLRTPALTWSGSFVHSW